MRPMLDRRSIVEPVGTFVLAAHPSIARLAKRIAIAATAAGTTAAGGVGLVAYLQSRITSTDVVGDGTAHDLNGPVGDPNDQTRRVVWLGDSLAAGLGAISPDMSLPRLVAAHDPRPTRIHSFAMAGATSADVVGIQLPALEQLRAGLAEVGEHIDVIAISVGANDVAALTPRRRFRQNLQAMISAAEGSPIVFMSIPSLSDALRIPQPLRSVASVKAKWLNDAIQDVAADAGAYYACVRRRPQWIRRRDLANFLSADRFHPSGAGYAVWAGRIHDAFELAHRHHLLPAKVHAQPH
jgi:lysophospholipase L1-like esterase